MLRIGKLLATALIVLVLTLYFGRAFDARRMPPLGPEHLVEFEHEFTASAEDETDWAEYLAIESRLANELGKKIPSSSRRGSPVDRYFADSLTSPDNYPGNWNHSYEVTVPAPRGVAVLLHGLTDSPYSMLATAQTMAGAGYNVVAPRMPGHGFAAGGLLQAGWKDWTAAVRVAIRHAKQLPGAEQSLVIVGYSNGGLLAIDYALQCDGLAELPCPDGLVLMSPGIAITRAAAVMNWHATTSWIPYFRQFKWLSILPEIDPFKFTSFPKQAAWEVHKISSRVHKQLAKPEKAASLPPILTFQSAVDYTVKASAIVTTLYDRLPANGSELVLYDVNRNSTMLYLMKSWPDDPVGTFVSRAPMDFGVTVLRNRSDSTNAIDAVSLPSGDVEPALEATALRWPTQVYSLSHIAIPFRPDDMLYGDGTVPAPHSTGLVLGAAAPRGEHGVMLLPPEYFLRAHYNPFFSFQARFLGNWLEELNPQP